MFNMNVKADFLKLDFDKYSKTLTNFMRVRMRNAARAFVRAAVQQNLVPIDTGMARGSFLNIGRLLRVAIPLAGARPGRLKGRFKRSIYYYGPDGRVLKTPQAGADLATQQKDIFSDDGVVFKFYYGNDVIHYNINDFFPRVRGAPWGSYEAGAVAFLDDMKVNLPKYIPPLPGAMVRITVTGGPGGVSTSTHKFGPDGEIEEEY